MKFRVFGRKCGLRVSELALGTGNFGTGWGHGATPEESRLIFERYVDAGGNFIDTADGYQAGESERIVGDLIGDRREQFVLATKYTLGVDAGAGIGRTGNARKNMVASVEASLRRLRMDYIDLYWAHLADGQTPMDEILRAFDDLTRSGKILYAGLSNFPAWRIARADVLADLRSWAPLVGIQFEYSLVERTADRELLPMAQALGLGTALWSPLGGGLLTGKYRSGETGRLQGLGVLVHTEKSARETAIVDTLTQVAQELDATPAQIAIAWLLAGASASPTAQVPILGPRSSAQLASVLPALNLTLTPAQLALLQACSEVALGVPHDMARASADRLAGGNAAQVWSAVVPVA